MPNRVSDRIGAAAPDERGEVEMHDDRIRFRVLVDDVEDFAGDEPVPLLEGSHRRVDRIRHAGARRQAEFFETRARCAG